MEEGTALHVSSAKFLYQVVTLVHKLDRLDREAATLYDERVATTLQLDEIVKKALSGEYRG